MVWLFRVRQLIFSQQALCASQEHRLEMKLPHLLLLLCLCCPGLTVSSSSSWTAFYCSKNWPFLSSRCQEEPTPGATDTQVPVSDEEDSKKADSCGGQLFSSEERRSLGGTIERLGLQLLENLPIVPQQPNIILSPLSVALALAHLTLGESEFSFVCPTIRSKHFPPPGSPTCLHQNVIFALLKLFLFCFLGFYCFFFFFASRSSQWNRTAAS